MYIFVASNVCLKAKFGLHLEKVKLLLLYKTSPTFQSLLRQCVTFYTCSGCLPFTEVNSLYYFTNSFLPIIVRLQHVYDLFFDRDEKLQRTKK